jgi:hypothetical protein
MSRNTLRFLAVVLTVLIVVVAFNAFDHLPGSVRAQIDSERSALAAAQKQLVAAQRYFDSQEQSHAALFRDLTPSQPVQGRFVHVLGDLQTARQQMSELTNLEQHGHYQDRRRAESLLATERGLRTTATGQIAAIQNDVTGWIERSQHLPAEAQQMQQEHQAVDAFNLTPL